MTRIAIIGAGIAGLACGRRLAQAGLHSVVFDKGRGIGGRVATRRADHLRFDHGAPYVAELGEGNGFASVLRGLIDAGHASPWADDTGKTWTVGTPGMSAIPKGLSAGLDVRLGTQVTALLPDGAGWRVRHDDLDYAATHVVVTVPAPQVAGLLGDAHPLIAQVAGVEMVPGLTLMAAISGDRPFVSHVEPDGPVGLIIWDSHKPDRPHNDGTAWVAQAGLAFSQAHLEESLPNIAARMVPLLCDRLGVTADRVTHAVAHRWRYSRVSKPLGQPFALSSDATLYLGGDWCIGRQIEDAWASGSAIAEDLLERGLR